MSHVITYTNIDGLAQITAAISIRYGCMCSEGSISILSEFKSDSEHFDEKYH